MLSEFFVDCNALGVVLQLQGILAVVEQRVHGADEDVAAPSVVQDRADQLLQHVAPLSIYILSVHFETVDKMHTALEVGWHGDAIVLVEVGNAVQAGCTLLGHPLRS